MLRDTLPRQVMDVHTLTPGPLRTLLEMDTGPWMIAAIVVLITLESLVYQFRGKPLNLREESASWMVGIGYFLVSVVGARLLTFTLYVYVYEHLRLWEWDITRSCTWLALLLGGDFVYYWTHRLEHEVRFFWATHENHHSALHYSFGTAIRMPWGEILYHPWIGLWAPLLGFPPLMYPLMGTFNLLMGLLQHTELIGRLGPLEWILATPSHHRVHHGSDDLYLDRNYGARLIVWDRLFGTFQPEIFHPTYGLTTNVNSYNPLTIVTHGYRSLWEDLRRAPRLRDKLRYFIMPPGWSHDGAHLSAKSRRNTPAGTSPSVRG